MRYHRIMSKFDKMKVRIKNKRSISYKEAESFLIKLGFTLRSIKGSHHIFSKDGYSKNISLKKVTELLDYQLDLLKEALEHYENNEK